METENNKPQLKSITCPACGAPVSLRALGQSVVTACQSCGAMLDVATPSIKLIKKYNSFKQRYTLKLGVRGQLRGQLFEVIGALERTESGYAWEEYLLFNPMIGFRWLIHDKGHWSLGESIKDIANIKPIGNSLWYRGTAFKLFHNGTARITEVLGEFYWRVSIGDKSNCSDYVANGSMLSKEKMDGEITWTLLQYLEPAEIEQTFHITSPTRLYIAPSQPNPNYVALSAIKKPAVYALLAAVVIQVLTCMFLSNVSIPLGDINPEKTPTGAETVFGPFTLSADESLDEINASSLGFDNAWVELSCSLVNENSGEVYDFTNAFEHYSGYDSDGSWSEGNREDTTLLTTIPKGEYTLVVDTATGNNVGQPLRSSIHLSMEHNVTPWRNFWIALGIIALYPAFLIWRGRVFEKERWWDSEFNPYPTDDDD